MTRPIRERSKVDGLIFCGEFDRGGTREKRRNSDQNDLKNDKGDRDRLGIGYGIGALLRWEQMRWSLAFYQVFIVFITTTPFLLKAGSRVLSLPVILTPLWGDVHPIKCGEARDCDAKDLGEERFGDWVRVRGDVVPGMQAACGASARPDEKNR